jgi:hypothetical protein
MTIRKLQPYGIQASRPLNLVTRQSDYELAQHFTSHDRAVPCTVIQGGIAQSLGITDDVQRDLTSRASHLDRQMTRVDLDLLQIEYRTVASGDNSLQIVVAGTLSLQNRTPLSTFLILSNSGYWRERDLLPRAHPNDGFVDVLEVDPNITVRQRTLAWRRSKTGSHLPHPHLRVRRTTDFHWSGRPSNMIADGVAFDEVVWLKCTVLADAMDIYF